MSDEYRSPKTLSYLAMIGVGLTGLCHGLALIVGIVQIFSPAQSINMPSGQQSSLWLIAQGLIALVLLPAYIFSVVVFLMWLFRVYKNLTPLKADSVEFSAGWAVGWWFVPLANLIKPFQAVRDAWLESDPDVEVEVGFLTSVKGGAPGFMSLWWACWIIANILSNISSRLMDSTQSDTIATSGYFFVAEGIFWIAAASLAIKVIREITMRQEMRFGKVGRLVDLPPPPPTFGSND